jgi:transitional endoplasmic reticulum ATPase
LADRIVRSKSRALSFCFSGTPGSGKSAYACHLAHRLDLEILEKRFSDLTSKYLGESEKAIAAAFEEAADLRAFLLLDEADSLLCDRTVARNSWEVTQVNDVFRRAILTPLSRGIGVQN